MKHHKSLNWGGERHDSGDPEDGTMPNPKFAFESDADFLRRVWIEEDLGGLAAMLDWEPVVRAVGIRVVSRYLVPVLVGVRRVAVLEEAGLSPRQKRLAAELLANDMSRRLPIFVGDVEGIAAFAATLVP